MDHPVDENMQLFQCVNGHIVCGTCRLRVKKETCPMCNVSTTEATRNRVAEFMCLTLSQKPAVEEPCRALMPQAAMISPPKQRCPIFACSACSQTLNDLREHLQVTHDVNWGASTSTSTLRFSFSQAASYEQTIVKAFDNCLVFLFYHPSGYWVYYAVGFDEEVHVELTLLTSDEASLSYCGPAYAIDN
ncbi:MAG: hypothetical protein KVP17_004505, partial [Porospora cf. gigantea B]|uniref:uncharacterized protein n=1 Tax=Porospora cf. gigantea B TaxID=2853592 RepID=UPI003571AEC1